jgi:PAS domain S-box-containing protein
VSEEQNRLNPGKLQAQLAILTESIEEAIINTAVDGTITAWNRAAERIFGYTAQEAIGKPTSIVVPAKHLDLDSQIFQRIRRGERIENYQTQRQRKDGGLIDVSLTLVPEREAMGPVSGVLIIARDTADRKRLENAERDQLLLAEIVSSADDAIISKDLNGIVTSWNKAAEKIFGYTADEMIGKPIARLIPSDHSEEEPLILERVRRGEQIDHYEAQRIRKDGTIIDVSVTVSPIRDRLGIVTGASKVVRDITDRKRWQKAEVAESFLGALVESADDAIVSKTLEGVVTSWNSAAERLYGYTAAEMIGKPIVILIPVDHPDEEPQILARIRRGERIQHYETKRVRKDGAVIDVSLTVSPIKDSLGRIIGASKIARDITQQKRGEAREREALRQAQEAKRQAEESSRAKDEFLATVSHELRTPMTAILGWTRMLITGQLSPDRLQRAIETIDRNARSQAQLVEDLLDVSRIVSGRLRIEYKTVDMAAVIAAAVESLRPAADAKRIHVRTVLSSGAGPVRGDTERLQQIVWNLLSNAIRFTPAAGTVQIELQRVESQIELRVIDSGIGIAPNFLPYIFDRFTQADSSITRSHGGLGMGLAIVKSLVELHGGVVAASSPGEDQGSVFTLKLPVSAVRQDYTEQRVVQRPSLKTALKDRHELIGIKILIVDDERDTCDLLRFIFNECGSIVQIASSTKEAVTAFDTFAPDILVSDIGMPEVDGYELIRFLRQVRRSKIPAVALTAMARIEDRVKALTAGYQMHVSKPVEPLELITVVSSLLGLVNGRPDV